jgi:hypothetical protein
MALLTDCETCMQGNDPQTRQAMGCGYEPPVELAPSVWCPPSGRAGYQGRPPTVCPGYTTKLPEVREAVQAHAHWNKGAIVSYCGGEHPSEELLQAVVILDGERSALEGWRMTSVEEGGGRE